jgi:hypothetical protein
MASNANPNPTNSGLASRAKVSAHTFAQRYDRYSGPYGSLSPTARKISQQYLSPPRPRPPCHDPTRPC